LFAVLAVFRFFPLVYGAGPFSQSTRVQVIHRIA